MGGEEAYQQWRRLEQLMAPLQAGASLLPAAALRGDAGVALTAGRFGPGLLKAGLVAGQLTGPFSGECGGRLKACLLCSLLPCNCTDGAHHSYPHARATCQPWWTKRSPRPGCAAS